MQERYSHCEGMPWDVSKSVEVEFDDNLASDSA